MAKLRWINPACLVWLLVLPAVSKAQTDPDKRLDWPEFKSLILLNHPLSRQAGLFETQASSMLLRARGGFDPKAYADHEAKEFSSSNYFTHTEAGIKWPTYLGVQVKGSYQWTSGNYLNPEFTLPDIGQASLGIEWSVLNSLFLDERRASLKMAQIGLDQGTAEKDALNNALLLEGAKIYWNWALARDQVQIFEEALRQAEIRNTGIRESFINGASAGIDTLESFIQVQNRRLDLNFARVDLQNALVHMTNFVWNEDLTVANPDTFGLPEPLTLGVYKTVQASEVETLRSTGRTNHPELRLYDAKIRTLEVERRLKNAKRMPELDVNYNILGNGWEFFPYSAPGEGIGVLATDIKWGVNFSFPLLNRKARGDLQVTDVKLAQTGQSYLQKKQEIDNKILQYANELQNLAEQIELYRAMTNNYRILLDGEMEKFRQGESTVFLINTREQRWLEAQIKYLKLLCEYRKTEAAMQAAAGILAD